MHAFVEQLARCDPTELMKLAHLVVQHSGFSFYDTAKQLVLEGTPQHQWVRTVPFIRQFLCKLTLTDDLVDIIIGYQREEKFYEVTLADTQDTTILNATEDITHGSIIRTTDVKSIVIYSLSGSILTYPILKIPNQTPRVSWEAARNFSTEFFDEFRWIVQFDIPSTPSCHPLIRWFQHDLSPRPIDHTVAAYMFPQLPQRSDGHFHFETREPEVKLNFSVKDYSHVPSHPVWTMVTEHHPDQFTTAERDQKCLFELRKLPVDHPAVCFLLGTHWQKERDKITGGDAKATIGIHTHFTKSRVYRAYVVFLSLIANRTNRTNTIVSE